MKAILHTPGTHYAILDRVDVRISPTRNHYMIRMRYRHKADSLATLYQHILWTPPGSTDSPDLGAFILSKIFSRSPLGSVERSASFWVPKDIEAVVQYLQKYIGKTFEVLVELRISKTSSETYPNLKHSFYHPASSTSPTTNPTNQPPKGA